MDMHGIPRCAICERPYDDAPEELCPTCTAFVFDECECDVCKHVRAKRRES